MIDAEVDDALSPDFPLGVELETFIRREGAERFVEEVRGEEPELAGNLRIEERDRKAHRRPAINVRSPRNMRGGDEPGDAFDELVAAFERFVGGGAEHERQAGK
jgi:hypothetical protein